MGHTSPSSEVTSLLEQYKGGKLTLDELVQRFRIRRWPRTGRPRPQTYMETAARTQQDPEMDVPDSFDDVEAAFFRHDLSVEEYESLRAAMMDALKAEERGEL